MKLTFDQGQINREFLNTIFLVSYVHITSQDSHNMWQKQGG